MSAAKRGPKPKPALERLEERSSSLPNGCRIWHGIRNEIGTFHNATASRQTCEVQMPDPGRTAWEAREIYIQPLLADPDNSIWLDERWARVPLKHRREWETVEAALRGPNEALEFIASHMTANEISANDPTFPGHHPDKLILIAREAIEGNADKMNASDFTAWVAHMKATRGWSARRCSRELGSGVNQIKIWSERGAPAYIGLACAALAFGLPAWRSV